MRNTNTFIIRVPKDMYTEDQIIEYLEDDVVPLDAISWAAENGYTRLTKVLIEHGAKVNENHNYPLELASKNGHTEIVRLLIDSGAKPSDSEDNEGYSLRLAAYNGHEEIVNMLLEAGANPMADKYYALRLALDTGNMAIAETLLDAIFKKRSSAKEA